MLDVYFKGRTSDEFDLIVNDIGRRQKAEEKIERIPIPMRSGDLVKHTGEYESYERQMIFVSLNKDQLSDIYGWLDGYGVLRTGDDKGGFFYASVIGGVDRTPISPTVNELIINFLVEPFFYLDGGEKKVEWTEEGTLVNQGAIESQPYIKIIGEGDITLEVNSQVVKLTGVEESITMDTKLMQCYRDTLNQGKKMSGNYIRFEKGDNAIRWTGNVSKIEIIPRWCDR